jgi:hypothetical protein
MMNEQSNTKISRLSMFGYASIPQTPLLNFFLIRLDNVDFSLNASTPVIQNKTNEGILKLLKQVRQLHILLISTSESLT